MIGVVHIGSVEVGLANVGTAQMVIVMPTELEATPPTSLER